MPDSQELPPTRWRVGDFYFDANRNRLSGNGRELLLEPKSAALLAYFCQHPGRNISRDELLRAVWHGQIVSDNSISRVVVLLRKALGDDEKSRRYIATVPKLGYRLIATVTGTDGAADPTPPNSAVSVHPRFWFVVILAAVLSGVALWQHFRPGPMPVDATRLSIAPLSRLALTQSNGDLAPDGKGLVFTASDGVWDRIYWAANRDADAVPISVSGGHANFATWAHGGDFVVYQFINSERCEFHRLDRDRFAAPKAEVIYECVPGSYTELTLAPDDGTLYFVERANPHAPYAVFSLALAEQSKERLSQPFASGYGNHFVDAHPRTGALLLLSNHEPGRTSVYELDPGRASFVLRRRFDYGLDSAIWSHRDDYIVHPSRHPSYRLVESSLSHEASRTLVSDSRRISSPRRIRGTGETVGNYLFTSYLYNRDIAVTGLNDRSFNSGVMDYLPALSHRADRLAFVSKRSGASEIWIKNLSTGSLETLATPDRGRRFHDLAWSPDDRQLLASSNLGLLVYSLEERNVRHELSPPLPAYAARWRDEQTVSYSLMDAGLWQAHLWDLGSGETRTLEPRWAFSLGNREQTLLLDQELTVFRDGEPLTALAQCAGPVWRYQLRYQLDGEHLYCHALDDAGDLLRFDADMRQTRIPHAVQRYEFFSVRGERLATTSVASSFSDIMRTRPAE